MSEYQVTGSIVLYNPTSDVHKTIESFLKINSLKTFLYLIDNSPSGQFKNENAELLSKDNVLYTYVGKNIGYGAGHNLALNKALRESEFHVVLNPDVYFNEDVVETIYQFASANPEVAHIMPKVLYPDGQLQYACKLVPTPFDLIARLFPLSLFGKRNEKFELRFTGYNKIMEVPYLAGCFMFFRCSALKVTGLFDERFFMYPEDIDITRRIYSRFKTIYYPHVHIYHEHERLSHKNLSMFIIHAKNMIRYFNKWGWFFDEERKKINSCVLKQFQ